MGPGLIMQLSTATKVILVIALAGVLAAVVIPNYIKARITRCKNTCIEVNLPMLAEAKRRWAADHGKSAGTIPAVADIVPYLPDGMMPACPVGGTYEIGPIGSNPACSLTNLHPWDSNAIRSEFTKGKTE